jgi:MYXO-CTERM domain-containing protein
LKTTGLCAVNPCEQVHCGQGQDCVVGDDASADCTIPIIAGIAVQTQAAGSGVFGCSCSLASATPSGRHHWLDALVVLAAASILLRRRRDRASLK